MYRYKVKTQSGLVRYRYHSQFETAHPQQNYPDPQQIDCEDITS